MYGIPLFINFSLIETTRTHLYIPEWWKGIGTELDCTDGLLCISLVSMKKFIGSPFSEVG